MVLCYRDPILVIRSTKATELSFLPVEVRIVVKINLLAHNSLLSGELRYIKNLLHPVLISRLCSSTSSSLLSQSKDILLRVRCVSITSYRMCCPLSITCLLLKINSGPIFFSRKIAYNLDYLVIEYDYKV